MQNCLKRGLSYTQIGKKLGVSRNAIAGKVHRSKKVKDDRKRDLVEVSWDRRTFETWDERKRRLSQERERAHEQAA